jgi:hypothetical protein
VALGDDTRDMGDRDEAEEKACCHYVGLHRDYECGGYGFTRST